MLVEGYFPIVNGVVTSFDGSTAVTLASYGLPLLHHTGTESLFRRIFAKRSFHYI